jgi:transcription elongation GreA/GreB family factor
MAKAIKAQLIQFLLAKSKEKISDLTSQAADLKESRNTESKSTAGDKHAVGRAMAQTELDTLEKRIAELKEQANAIKQLHSDTLAEVRRGSLVETSNGVYFLAIGLGKVRYDEKDYFVVSPAAPIGQAMLGKKSGEHFEFRGQEIKIRNVS